MGESETPARAASAGGHAAIDTAAYLARIGFRDPVVPTEETLRALHLAHLLTVPFENLDVHLGRPIVLDEALLFDKIVRRRRGGFCYELNGLFAALPRAIGFDVALLAARFPRDDGRPAPETDHLVLLVRAPEGGTRLLTDVGAGRDSFAHPLRVGTAAAQPCPVSGSEFRLVPEGERHRLQRQEPSGAWEPRYALAWWSRRLADFAEGCLLHQTSPASDFPRTWVCTVLTPEGRITLSERLITTRNGARTEEALPDDTACHHVLRTLFGIDLEAERDGHG